MLQMKDLGIAIVRSRCMYAHTYIYTHIYICICTYMHMYTTYVGELGGYHWDQPKQRNRKTSDQDKIGCPGDVPGTTGKSQDAGATLRKD